MASKRELLELIDDHKRRKLDALNDGKIAELKKRQEDHEKATEKRACSEIEKVLNKHGMTLRENRYRGRDEPSAYLDFCHVPGDPAIERQIKKEQSRIDNKAQAIRKKADELRTSIVLEGVNETVADAVRAFIES